MSEFRTQMVGEVLQESRRLRQTSSKLLVNERRFSSENREVLQTNKLLRQTSLSRSVHRKETKERGDVCQFVCVCIHTTATNIFSSLLLSAWKTNCRA